MDICTLDNIVRRTVFTKNFATTLRHAHCGRHHYILFFVGRPAAKIQRVTFLRGRILEVAADFSINRISDPPSSLQWEAKFERIRKMVPGIQRATTLVVPIIKNERDRSPSKRVRVIEPIESFGTRENLKFLQKQVKLLSFHVEELEAEKKNASHNTAIWQRRVEEQGKHVQERDAAIAKLLDENLLMKKELQIERQAHSTLRHTYDDSMRRYEDDRVKTALQHERMMKVHQEKIDELENQLSHHKSCNIDPSSAEQEENLSRQKLKVKRLIAENEDLMTENEAKASELRDLKRQLRLATDSSSEIQELKLALTTAKKQISVLEQDKLRVVESVRSEVRAAEDMHRHLEQALNEMEAHARCVEGEKSTEECEARIKELEDEVNALKSGIIAKTVLSSDVEVQIPQEVSPDLPAASETSQRSDFASHLVESQGALLQYSGNKIHSLQQALLNKENELIALKETSATVTKVLEAKLQSTEQSLDETTNQVKLLESKLTRMEAQMDQTTSGVSSDMTNALDDARKAREASEKSIIKTYEDRLAEKDATIRELREDLAATRNKRSVEVTDLNRELEMFRTKFARINDDHDEELKKKDQHIYALEHALHSQEKTLDTTRAQLDQLRQSMQDTTTMRRHEVEELQGEVIALRTQMSNRDKETTSLQMQLKERELQHRDEVVKLKELVSDLEKELPMIKTIATMQSDQHILMVRERLDQLKSRNAELNDENRALGHRLEKNIIKIHCLEQTAREAKDAKIECDALRKQVSELQETLEKCLSCTSTSTQEDDPVADMRRTRPRIRRAKTMVTPLRRFLA
jgi:hypothetical protein